MTAITLTAPRRIRPARPVVRRSIASATARPTPVRAAGRAAPAPAARRAGRATVAPRTASRATSAPRLAAPRQPLRLTRRGRLAITGALTVCGVGLSLWTGTVSLAGTQPQQVSVRYVSVAPGDTLWSIAAEVAPGQDRRDTVHRIVELNALPSAELAVGQRVAVPTAR